MLVESNSLSGLANNYHLVQFSGEQWSDKFLSVIAFLAKFAISSAAPSRKDWGQSSSTGSIHKDAQITARQAANGRRAVRIQV